MKQLIFIHGGTIFANNEDFCKLLEKREYDPFKPKLRRKDFLKKQLAEKYEIIQPEMPNKHNACYQARKVWFEKIFPYLNENELTVIGHSLGGMFLLKYISENGFPKRIKNLYLISSCLDEKEIIEEEKYLGNFLFNLEKIPNIQNIAEKITIIHSIDDPVVPYSHAERLSKYLPKAKLITLTDRGHVNQPDFPELFEMLLK